MSQVKQFRLPDVGEGLTEAEIVSWRVKVGDTVAVNDIVVEIETAKSLVELPCPYAGTVTDLMVAEGQTVEVGAPIIAVTEGVGTPQVPEVETPPSEGAVEPGLIGGPAPGGRTSVLVGYGPRTTEAKRRPRKGSAVPTGVSSAAAQQGVQRAFATVVEPADLPSVDEAEQALPADSHDPAQPTGRAHALAKPPVRKLAKDLGIDLSQVSATGPGGVVTRADVQAHVSTPMAVPEAVAGGETRIPVRGVRKATAQAMVTSAFTAPHVTEWVTLDVTKTMDLVEMLRTHRDFRDVRVSPLLVIAKAICLALRRTPELNSRWDEAAQEIVLKHDVNLGIAAATPRGLIVPNIKRAQAMSLADLGAALGSLVTTAREGRTQPAEMSGGTFTITNVGVFGIDAGTPILNPGESGIMAVGAISKRPWVIDDAVVPRWVTTLAVSFDHRIVDGEQGSRFLADVAAILHDPATALLF